MPKLPKVKSRVAVMAVQDAAVMVCGMKGGPEGSPCTLRLFVAKLVPQAFYYLAQT